MWFYPCNNLNSIPKSCTIPPKKTPEIKLACQQCLHHWKRGLKKFFLGVGLNADLRKLIKNWLLVPKVLK
jgi:hypothetical protein